MGFTLHFIQAERSREVSGFHRVRPAAVTQFPRNHNIVSVWGNMVEQFCQTKQEGMCAQRQRAPIHKHTRRGRYFLFVLFSCAAEASDGAQVGKRLGLNARSQSKMSKQNGDDGDGRGRGGQTVCDKRKASWEIAGLLHEPQGSRDPERAKEEKAGRRQERNSLTLFGGLCLNAL